jgi:hypothetical protein
MGEPDTFLEVVEYQDREAYERDQQRVENDPAMKSLLEQWRSLHAGPVAAEAYYELNPCSPPGDDHA